MAASQSCPPSAAGASSFSRPDDLEQLKFQVVSTDGGQYSQQYKCENMLQNDANVYCTKKKEAANILLTFSEDVPFHLTHIIVKAPEHGFAAPIGEGLIFVSHAPLDAASTAEFDKYDATKYKQFLAGKHSRNEPLRPNEPAAYFNLHDGWCLIQRLDVPRSGMFVLVKLLRSRVPAAESIDIQYLGFRGFVGPRSFAYGDIN